MLNRFYKQMTKLVEICYDQLPKNKYVYKYLVDKRKITKKTIDKFYLGAFPTDLRMLIKEFDPKFLIKTGILYRADRSPFTLHPIIFPICDVNDNFIGIAGRTLLSADEMEKSGLPKYRNSQYDKAHHLFGLNYAKQSIRDKDSAIVVEGYFDMISAYQSGLTNISATSGTYLSAHQMMLLSRYTENVNLLFDNDAAGERAAGRVLDREVISGIKLKRISLPKQYKDIDEYIVAGNSF